MTELTKFCSVCFKNSVYGRKYNPRNSLQSKILLAIVCRNRLLTKFTIPFSLWRFSVKMSSIMKSIMSKQTFQTLVAVVNTNLGNVDKYGLNFSPFRCLFFFAQYFLLLCAARLLLLLGLAAVFVPYLFLHDYSFLSAKISNCWKCRLNSEKAEYAVAFLEEHTQCINTSELSGRTSESTNSSFTT